jgi:DNA (cytosine-5)-methyltransferase 1
MTAYYNEFDPKAAAWLRELIRAGLIAPGDVDERSIKDVKADDLANYKQCHFFAGIGGWSYALRLAGWADATPVWTGSCPCQPYSSAGKQRGNADDRNLWPDFYRLIAECKPDVVFGEQVEGAIRHGWLDGVSADLEREGYAIGHCVLGAHSVGAPHIRQRLYWVADAGSQSGQRHAGRFLATQTGVSCANGPEHGDRAERLGDGGSVVALADTGGISRLAADRYATKRRRKNNAEQTGMGGSGSGMGYANGGRQTAVGGVCAEHTADTSRNAGGMEHAARNGRIERRAEPDGRSVAGRRGWDDYELAQCRDGKARRVAPGVPLLAHGLPGRVAQLRGLGNAIVPQVAAAFIEAYLETTRESSNRNASR